METNIRLQMKEIRKSFWGVAVLKGVSLELKKGEVVGLLGENGAGKSTLMKILGGIYASDSGEILIEGKKVEINTPKDAQEKHISFLHQELSLVPDMTVAENIFLGNYPVSHKFVDDRKLNKDTQALLDILNLDIAATDIIRTLNVAQQQMVEIAKAISMNANIIVMDEPTSSLTDKEVVVLLNKIKELKASGVSVIYISHRMEEIYQICDRVYIMRDGIMAGERAVNEKLDPDEVVRLLVGREIKQMFTDKRAVGKEVILEAKNLNNRYLKDVSFQVKRGEVFALAGLVGAGRTEIARAVFGLDSLETGEILLNGEKVHFDTPQKAIDAGIGLVPEDRKRHGLILGQTVGFNLTLPVVRTFIKGIRVNKKKETQIIDEYKNKLSIKMTGPDQVVGSLSGGNQQKVVISKWMAARPQIMIMDEPTRGIDVGAKNEIYDLISQLTENGVTVIMISSELPEIINLSSRIAIMYEGKLMKIIDVNEHNGEVTQEEIMHYAMGGK